jgi:hypothetical protein
MPLEPASLSADKTAADRPLLLRDRQAESEKEMKFFTPELLERFQSPDERTSDLATDEWENRAAAYEKTLAAIQSQLPKEFVRLMRRYALHDATVISYGKTATKDWANGFGIFLTLERLPDEVLLLLYKVKGEPSATSYASATPASSPTQWLYDEVEVTESGALFNLIHPTTFRHSILLSNHQELRVDFTDFRLVAVKQMSNAPALPHSSHA